MEETKVFILKHSSDLAMTRFLQNQQGQPRKHQSQVFMEEKANVNVHPRLVSFLEKDNSFLSPWSWNPKAFNSSETSSSTKEINHFVQGSFFATQGFDYTKTKESSSK